MNKVKGSFWKSTMVSIMMNNIGSGLFTTRTVDELLWGYEDPLLVQVSSSNPEVETIFGLMYKACIALQLIKSDETQLDSVQSWQEVLSLIGNLSMCKNILVTKMFGSI